MANLWPAYESSLASAVVEVVCHRELWDTAFHRDGHQHQERMYLLLKVSRFPSRDRVTPAEQCMMPARLEGSGPMQCLFLH